MAYHTHANDKNENNSSYFSEEKGKGLNTELHSALFSSNLNLIKREFQKKNVDYKNDREGEKKRKDNGSDNYYLSNYNDTSTSNEYTDNKLPKNNHTKRLLGNKFYTKPGELTTLLTEKQKALTNSQQAYKSNISTSKDETYDNEVNSMMVIDKAYIETCAKNDWWDNVYLKTRCLSISDIDPSGSNDNILHRKYTDFIDYSSLDVDEDSDDDIEEYQNEQLPDRPSIRFIQHPILIKNKSSTAYGNTATKIYLTKKEHKKLRRNRRKLERQVKEERIKLGMDLKPTPKVKLSNMMNVIQNNSNIMDPTLYEKEVREQVQERKREHEKMNQQRHLEAVAKKRKKNASNDDSDVSTNEIYCCVFKIEKILNPKHRFKINMNAKQLNLQGCCLRLQDGKGIIIIRGLEKNCKKYKKLILNRIAWRENFTVDVTKTKKPSLDNNAFDLSLLLSSSPNTVEVNMTDNEAKLEWEGYLDKSQVVNNDGTKKWFMKECKDLNELLNILDDFNAKVFW
ncbi:U4/U6-U5 snRNP complex subunit PRP3 SCDLUD_004892 [Saccharomycodes ludwigii]|uniref:U4/U6-U5 snRNP complex subunit PRP3 n=1 Tax=Saccharomycodes ludwigii TaxID=36035 RepID=UPI001E8914A1|nr:hypothetical protein SCDLUD_004892 [Saccharomycodes ludwigii]KAH3899449.1 hypothetical protein SCDLUD_004892 [Saccharomycodes ludwigii]